MLSELQPSKACGTIRGVDELELLKRRDIPACLWAEDALIYYNVPTSVFDYLFILVSDEFMDAAVECLDKEMHWKKVPIQLGARFDISNQVANKTQALSGLTMMERSTFKEYSIVLVPAQSFAHFTITAESTTYASSTQYQLTIPTFSSLACSLVVACIHAGKTYFKPGVDPSDKEVARGIFTLLSTWHTYLVVYNPAHVAAAHNKGFASMLAVAQHLERTKHALTYGQWRFLCEAYGAIAPLSDDRSIAGRRLRSGFTSFEEWRQAKEQRRLVTSDVASRGTVA